VHPTKYVFSMMGRYARTKIANGGKLAPGTLEAICAGVKLEMGMPDMKMSTLESKTQVSAGLLT